jgi:hypothetical protein
MPMPLDLKITPFLQVLHIDTGNLRHNKAWIGQIPNLVALT